MPIKTLLTLLFVSLIAGKVLQAEPHSSCCWCTFKYQDDTQLAKYFGPQTCEKLTTELRSCRKIDVLGNSCNLVTVTGGRGALKCERTPVYYLEEGKRKTIAPPAMTVCDRSKLTPGDGPGIPSDERIRCICSNDPSHGSYCVLSVTEGGTTLGQITAPMEDGQAGCSPDRCAVLFKDSPFGKRCSTYIQGGS